MCISSLFVSTSHKIEERSFPVQCFKGLGTNDDDLIRTLVSREGNELKQIKEVYKELYKETLEADIEVFT